MKLNMNRNSNNPEKLLDDTFVIIDRVLERHHPGLRPKETGAATYVGHGIARIQGLPEVKSEEMVMFQNKKRGLVFNLDLHEAAVIILDESEGIESGTEVRRTGRVLETPVGDVLLGRVIDPLGRPLDNGGPVRASEKHPIEKEAPAIMERASVNVPLQTGLQVVDALIPVGRGQRELILGDRQTGKTAIAIDTIINQKGRDVICIYCAIGQQSSAVAKIIEDLHSFKAMQHTIVVAATGEDSPGLNYVAPYAATTMAEFFMARGQDVLVVYDDITRHARAYRELSLLLRRPPAREAYPGDIFYIHSRLLERATHLRSEYGGGTLTALPIIETQAENISAYIPTNLISITDGQIYLSPKLYQQGILPAVDVGKSVSRVGGKTQLPAYRAVAGDLRLAYSQFQELEAFSRFGTRLEKGTRRTLERGRRVREVLKQPQYHTIPAPEQIAVLLTVNEGLFDGIPLKAINEKKALIRKAFRGELSKVSDLIMQGEDLKPEDRKQIVSIARKVLENSKVEK